MASLRLLVNIEIHIAVCMGLVGATFLNQPGVAFLRDAKRDLL